MQVNRIISHDNLGIVTKFMNTNFKKLEGSFGATVDEFVSRANVKGQFLDWVDLPKRQLARINEIYDLVGKLKSQTGAKKLSILGIGGSKHTVEHMLGVNGLNVKKDNVLFYSDIDSSSFNRFLNRMDGDVTKSNFLVASKSGSTFETKDGMLRIKEMLVDAYRAKGKSEQEAKKLASKHFIAVTDKNPKGSELRRLSDSESWLGNLFIHDDVGGRFSALDDHALFTLAYAGMKKEDMIKMLNGADDMTKIATSSADVAKNSPLAQAAFWVNAKLKGINTTVHQYLGDMFESTEKWHAQMQNESIKDTSKQIAKITDAMHHSSEAWYNPQNRFAFAMTAPIDKGIAKENVEGYVNAIAKSNSDCGPSMVELVATSGMGLKPETAGAMSQSRAFATVYQDILEHKAQKQDLPEVLDSVLQPHVEFYKKNLKPIDGNQPPVVAGRKS